MPVSPMTLVIGADFVRYNVVPEFVKALQHMLDQIAHEYTITATWDHEPDVIINLGDIR